MTLWVLSLKYEQGESTLRRMSKLWAAFRVRIKSSSDSHLRQFHEARITTPSARLWMRQYSGIQY